MSFIKKNHGVFYSNKPVIYLQIGTNKTGTSTIQRVCNSKRDSLALAGVLYPQAGCSGEAHYALSDALGFAHKNIPYAERSLLLNELKLRLHDEMQRWKPRIVVFSSENFILPGNPVEVAEYFKDFIVYIVVYLRRHDTWWPSTYNQAVREVRSPPWGVSFEDFLHYQEKHAPLFGNYRHLIDRWATAFGPSQILVRPYEKQQNFPHIVADFFRTIDREDLAPAEIPRTNESVDAWSLRMIDIAQRAEIDDFLRAKIINFTLSHSSRNKPALRISPKLLRQLLDKHLEDYEYIARNYLGREEGKLFYDPLPSDSDVSTRVEPSPREIMTWTVQAITSEQPS